MKRLRPYVVDLLTLAGFLILPFLLYGAVTFGSRTMLPVDNLFQWAPWQAHAAALGVELPHNNLLSDLIIENYVWKRFAINSIRAGEIPLWNPYLFAGAPFLANGQHGMLYPFSWIFFLIPIAKAYGWFTVSQLWLAGAAMFFLGRVLKMERGGALIAGLVYQGSGFMLVSAAVFPMIISAAAWLPLLLAVLEMTIRSATRGSRATLLWAAAGAVFLGLQVLAGHVEITYYTLLIMAVFALWRLVDVMLVARRDVGETGPWYRPALLAAPWLIALVAVGLLLGGVQLVPFYEIGRLNFREGAASFAEVRGWAFPARRILTLLLPNFFGNPAHHAFLDPLTGRTVQFTLNSFGQLNPQGAQSSAWGVKNYVEGGIYLGILPLFLALLGSIAALWHPLSHARRSQGLFFVLLAFFSLAFIFGTPLYALLYYGLPFINQLHTPFRWVWPLSLAVAALAGFGTDMILIDRQKVRGALKTLIAAAAIGGAVILAMLLLSRTLYGQFDPWLERVFRGLALADTAFPDAHTFYGYQFWNFLILGASLLGTALVLWLGYCGRKYLFVILAALLILSDLFLANRQFNAATDEALLSFQPELAAWLSEQPGQWRLTSFTPHGDKPLNANGGWLYDLQDIRGYDSIISKQYTQYMAAIEPQNELPNNRIQPIGQWESLNSPLLDVAGVRYVISSEQIDLPKMAEVWQGEGVHVYENLAAAPRTYTLPLEATAVVDDPLAAMTELDPRSHVVLDAADLSPDMALRLQGYQEPLASTLTPAHIAGYRNIEVLIDTAVQSPSWLILNDSYFPGWKAFVRPVGAAEDEEQEIGITRVNGNFRGVLLEPGAWTVRFRYSPGSFQLGGLLSAMGLIVLMFASGVWVWRRAYRPEGELSTTHSVVKNSALPMGLNLFNRLIDFVFAMYYLRVLGPSDAGRYVAAITTAGFFEILANYGLDILLIRDVSRDRDSANHYLFNTTILRLLAAVVASIPVLIFMWGTQLTQNPLTTAEIAAVLLIMVGMIFSGMSKGVTGLFYVYEEAEIPAAMTTATTILKVGLGVLVLLLGYSFVGLAAVSIIVNIVTLVVLVLLAANRFSLHGPWRFDSGLQRQLIRKGFPLMLIHLLQTIFISIDILLLRLMLVDGEEVVGYYQNAYKWFNALQIIPAFFTLALFPVISREIENSMDSARRMYKMSLKLMLLLALVV
ncbi:MAG: oligosaccharide flippase family protein, partial [Candidatus Promineifilaceae bacterium]